MNTEFIEVTFVIPCLNESRTIKHVIKSCHKAGKYFESYEIIIADNMSKDNSAIIAEEAKANVIKVKTPGYGSALKEGIKSARGKYIVMGDADNTYDFMDSLEMIKQIKTYSLDLVVGDRFKGKLEEGAMPKLHRYFGNPILSTIGKFLYLSNINDFHCGIRSFKRKSIIALDLKSNGMEYASEMIIRSLLANYKINQVPVSLRKSIPDRIPHLHSWRDGWRHLKLLLTFSPKFSYFPISVFSLILSLILFILYLRNQDPFAGTNTLMFIIVFYNFALSSFSEYITCRLLISNNIKYKTNFLSEFLFNLISKYEYLDKAYQIIVALLICFSIQVILLIYKMNQYSNFLQTKTGNLYSFNLMLITSTVLFLYLSSSKLGTIYWLNKKNI